FSPEFEEFCRRNPILPGLTRGTVTGRTALEGKTVHVPDIVADPEFTGSEYEIARKYFRTSLGVPLLREGRPIGVFTLTRPVVKPFTEKQIEVVTTFANQAVIAIENARLLDELQARTRELQEAFEYQTATSDALNVISRSPTDVQPVFDMIAESAWRLCEAQYCFVYQFDCQLPHFVAHNGLTPQVLQITRRAYPAPPGQTSVAARAVLKRSVVQISDVDADAEYALGEMVAAGQYKSAIG